VASGVDPAALEYVVVVFLVGSVRSGMVVFFRVASPTLPRLLLQIFEPQKHVHVPQKV
jgi:hypothetical protein